MSNPTPHRNFPAGTVRWAIGACSIAILLASPAEAQRIDAPERCSICKRRIDGRYRVYPDRELAVCMDCERTRPRCARCDVPQAPSALRAFGERRFCRTCLGEMPHCDACGDPIFGKHFTIRHREGRFCQSCVEERPHCSACGRPIGRAPTRLADGRRACAECMATAIVNERDARAMLVEIRTIARKAVGVELARDIELRLVGRDDETFKTAVAMARAATSTEENGRENGVFIQRGEKWTILVLKLLPRELFYETLAHEYGHALHAAIAPEIEDATASEGFAQWIAALTLQAKGFEAALGLLYERSDLYGVGFRRVLGASERIRPTDARGVKALIEASAR